MTPEEKKYLKIGGISAGILLIGYLLFRKPKDTGGYDNDPTNNNSNNNSNGGYNYPSFDPAVIADNLFQFMDTYGTKEDEIVAELTNINQTQFGQVVKAFGKKPYYLFGGNDWLGTPRDLKYWLQEELGISSRYYKTLKLKYPNYL